MIGRKSPIPGVETVNYQELADELGLDKSAARRRALVAIEKGFLENEETRKGKTAKLVVATDLPSDDGTELLPTAERVQQRRDEWLQV